MGKALMVWIRSPSQGNVLSFSVPDQAALCPPGKSFGMQGQNTNFPLGCNNSADPKLSFKSQTLG